MHIVRLTPYGKVGDVDTCWGMAQMSHDHIRIGKRKAVSVHQFPRYVMDPPFLLVNNHSPVASFVETPLPNPATFKAWGIMKTANDTLPESLFWCAHDITSRTFLRTIVPVALANLGWVDKKLDTAMLAYTRNALHGLSLSRESQGVVRHPAETGVRAADPSRTIYDYSIDYIIKGSI